MIGQLELSEEVSGRLVDQKSKNLSDLKSKMLAMAAILKMYFELYCTSLGRKGHLTRNLVGSTGNLVGSIGVTCKSKLA